MFSVFSNTNMKCSDQIRALQKCAGSDFTRILLAGSKDEPLYMLKPEIMNTLVWINKKILFFLPQAKDSRSVPYWVGVRIRIATNMLNKHVDSGLLSKEMAIEYHQRLTSRVRQILSEIWTEDLPF